MPKIDLPIKRLLQQRPADWVNFILPDCREEWIKPYYTEFVPKQESRLDKVLEVDDPRGMYLINFEPMGYYDIKLPARMLRYRGDIWEYTLSKGKGIPPIRQIVIFFYPEHDSKNHLLIDYWGVATMLSYTYRVIHVWEESRQQVIDKKLLGLYPLLPLMKGEKGDEKPEEVLQQSILIIQQVKDISLQQDLLATMAVLVSHKYPVALVLSMIGREMIMESPVYQEWVKEAEAKGRLEGKAEGKAEAICKLLTKRFGLKSLTMQDKVNSITNKTVLDWIFDEIIDITDLKIAQNIIDDAMKQIMQQCSAKN